MNRLGTPREKPDFHAACALFSGEAVAILKATPEVSLEALAVRAEPSEIQSKSARSSVATINHLVILSVAKDLL